MKNQKGQILLITIMLVATVLTVVLAVTFKSTSETQITKLEEQSQKALTAAEAGIEAALQQESGSVSIGSLPGFSGSGFSGQASVESITDSKFVSPLLLRDQQYTFYLADYPGFANPLSGYLAVYFQSEVECPALELTFLGSPGSGSSTPTPTLTPTPIPPTPTRTRTPTPAGPTPTRTPTPTATRTPTPQPPAATPTPLPCVTSSTTWQNKTFTTQTGTFTTEFDATPSQNGVSHTYIGLSNGSASANSDIVAKIRFGSGGNIAAFNGSNSTGSISYLGGVTYHIRMVVNITTDTYDVYVTPQGQAEQTLATNLSFSSSVTQLNNRGIHTESTPGSVSICNFSISGGAVNTPTPSSIPTPTRTPTPQAATATPTPLPCVTSSTTWQNKTFTTQTGTFTTEFDATPSQNGVSHTYIGLSNGSASANSDIVAKIRFGSGGNIAAFNGSNSTGSISYLGGVTYHIRMVVNITTDTYDVYVTPQGQAEQTLATNLSFSSSVTQLNNRGIHTESTPGSVSICNFSAAGQVLGVTSTDITRRLIDPCGRISKPAFSDLPAFPGSPPFSLGGYSFVYKTQPIPVSNQALLIARSLFASTRVGLELTGGGTTLPVQGKYVTSEAKTPSGVSRKVQLFQSYPQIPAEFFVTSF